MQIRASGNLTRDEGVKGWWGVRGDGAWEGGPLRVEEYGGLWSSPLSEIVAVLCWSCKLISGCCCQVRTQALSIGLQELGFGVVGVCCACWRYLVWVDLQQVGGSCLCNNSELPVHCFVSVMHFKVRLFEE